MQPTFLPWLGYFKMMQLADQFIFLDDVQISPKSFQVRNRIPKKNGQSQWIGLQVDTTQELKQRKLNTTGLSDSEKSFLSIRNTLSNSYAESDELACFIELFRSLISCSLPLGEVNIRLIMHLAGRFGITDNSLLASSFTRYGTGSAGIIELLEQVGATEYLVAPGSLSYMKTEDIWNDVNFTLIQFDFLQAPYEQSEQVTFLPFMSSLDVLLELGAMRAKKHLHQSEYKLEEIVLFK